MAFRFTGLDEEFDISAEQTGEPREFFDWRWMQADALLGVAPEFKVSQYRRVFGFFEEFLIQHV